LHSDSTPYLCPCDYHTNFGGFNNTAVSDYLPNVIAGCESWLSSSISASEIFPVRYTAYRKQIKVMDMEEFAKMALSVKSLIWT